VDVWTYTTSSKKGAMLRWWIILGWFVGLFTWNLYPAWSVGSDLSDAPRLFLIALRKLTTPADILLSIAAIVLILIVKVKYRSSF